jgi:hypothetical protein
LRFNCIVQQSRSLGINQLGVVEHRIEGAEIDACFRSVPMLVEDEPFGLAAFSEALASIGASRAEVA